MQPPAVAITGKDYAFDVPASFPGGLVRLSFANQGKEPHFAGFAKVARGKTFADVKAAMTAPPTAAPPSGPPPFERLGGVPSISPGATNNMTFTLPPGTYALFCEIPSPDGAPHSAKGMISEVTLTEGATGDLPASVGTVIANEFSLNPLPTLKAGTNVVRLRNEGKQLHELNLVELGPNKVVGDVVAWYRQGTGPPPMRFLGGLALKAGDEGTTELDLKTGSTYAFICEIPDFLGDYAPHITKGMYTQPFTVSG